MHACWECDAVGEVHHHHPVPRSRGGTRTIPLCIDCHGKAHARTMSTSQMTKDGLAKAKARGVKLGPPTYGQTVVEQIMMKRAVELRNQGLTLHETVAALTREGFRAKCGKPLSASVIYRIDNKAIERAEHFTPKVTDQGQALFPF